MQHEQLNITRKAKKQCAKLNKTQMKLTRKTLETSPMSTVSTNMTFSYYLHCGICWQNYNTNSNYASMRCGHVFHRNCLLQWFKQRQRCPKCEYRDIWPWRKWMNIYMDGRMDAIGSDGTFDLIDPPMSHDANANLYEWHNLLRVVVVPLISLIIAVMLFQFVVGLLATNQMYGNVAFEHNQSDEMNRLREQMRLQLLEISRLKTEKQRIIDHYERKIKETGNTSFMYGFLGAIIIYISAHIIMPS